VGRILSDNVFADTVSEEKEPGLDTGTLTDITVKGGLTTSPVEASGILFLDDTGEYVIVSDDTDRKEPALFLMNASNSITRKVLVSGLKKINDIEGITGDGKGFVYLLSSQSHNRKGKLSESRKLLIKTERHGSRFQMRSRVVLFDLLIDAALMNPRGTWEKFILSGMEEKSIDIEGIAFRDDTLLLGFKSPKLNNRAVILKIDEGEKLFSDNLLGPATVSLWKTLPLFDKTTATYCGISDLIVIENDLFGTATGVISRHGIETDIGLVWHCSTGNEHCRIMKTFTGKKPEGITYNREENILKIVFDNGVKNLSQTMKVKVSL
jgi:hypothetical protein